MLKQNPRMKIQDCRVKRGPNCGSHHYMLELKVVLLFDTKVY